MVKPNRARRPQGGRVPCRPRITDGPRTDRWVHECRVPARPWLSPVFCPANEHRPHLGSAHPPVHWVLFVCVPALVVTAKVGGNAMNLAAGWAWCSRCCCLGCCGASWAGIGRALPAFFPPPARLGATWAGRHGRTPPATTHWARCRCWPCCWCWRAGRLRLFSDDDIAFRAAHRPGVRRHGGSPALTEWLPLGPVLVIGLVALHLLAIVVYRLRRQNLVRPMVLGDKTAGRGRCRRRATAPPRACWRWLLLALAAGVVWWVVQLGSRGALG